MDDSWPHNDPPIENEGWVIDIIAGAGVGAFAGGVGGALKHIGFDLILEILKQLVENSGEHKELDEFGGTLPPGGAPQSGGQHDQGDAGTSDAQRADAASARADANAAKGEKKVGHVWVEDVPDPAPQERDPDGPDPGPDDRPTHRPVYIDPAVIERYLQIVAEKQWWKPQPGGPGGGDPKMVEVFRAGMEIQHALRAGTLELPVRDRVAIALTLLQVDAEQAAATSSRRDV